MIIAAATQKMIEFYKGNIHDIDHFLKVWAMANGIRCGYETKLVKKLTAAAESIDTRVDALDGAIARFKTLSDVTEGANFIRDEMLSRMTELRVAADEAETLTAESAWPFPTYGDLLFSVK